MFLARSLHVGPSGAAFKRWEERGVSTVEDRVRTVEESRADW
jgi:hypothetical protein